MMLFPSGNLDNSYLPQPNKYLDHFKTSILDHWHLAHTRILQIPITKLQGTGSLSSNRNVLPFLAGMG